MLTLPNLDARLEGGNHSHARQHEQPVDLAHVHLQAEGGNTTSWKPCVHTSCAAVKGRGEAEHSHPPTAGPHAAPAA